MFHTDSCRTRKLNLYPGSLLEQIILMVLFTESCRELKLVGCGLGSRCVFTTSLSIPEAYVYFPLEEQKIHVLFQWDYQVSAAPPQV